MEEASRRQEYLEELLQMPEPDVGCCSSEEGNKKKVVLYVLYIVLYVFVMNVIRLESTNYKYKLTSSLAEFSVTSLCHI
jgi:F0F1-type ATP synthase membrane subunit a